MVEYGVNVNNKFGFLSDDDAEDPSVLLDKVEKKEEKTATQKKAEKKAKEKEKLLQQAKAEEAKKAAAAALAKHPAGGKENTRPDSGRGRGGRGGARGGLGPRPPREQNSAPTEGGEHRTPREGGRGRGGPPRGGRGAFRGGRGGGGNISGGEEREGNEENKEIESHGDREHFAGRGRGGRGGRGGFRPDFNREDRPPREDRGDRPPRGTGGGRGGRGRAFDRQSGSDRSGVKPVDAKGGHGRGNWGTDKDEIAGETEPVVAAEGEETPAEPPAPREKTAEELEQERILEEISKQKTLKEFRAEHKREAPKFNLRKPEDGGDKFGKLVPLQKQPVEGGTQEEIVVIKKEPREKRFDIQIQFTPSNRGGFDGEFRGGRGRGGGDRGGRGPRGGGRGAGPRLEQRRGQRPHEPFRASEEAFPALC